MKILIQYILAFFWGLVTPSLAGIGAEYARDVLRPSGPAPGLTEFFLLLAGIALLCVVSFLVFNVLYSRLVLPEKSPRTRHFLLTLLLYVFMCAVGWFLGVWLAGIL